MKDFILNDKRFLAYYIGLWLITTTGLFLVLDRTTEFVSDAILIDSIFSPLLFFIILLALWYVVRFSGGYSAEAPDKLFGTLLASMVLLAVWAYFSTLVVETLTRFESGYAHFLKDILWVRVLSGFLFAFIVNLLFYNFFLIRYSREARGRENELKDLVQRTELQALKNQLNPHFIYNSLNSISSLTLTAPEKAREMVIRLSDFLRYALKQDAMQMTSLKKELENIESYLQIEKVRFGDRLKYCLDIDPESSGQAIPVMLLQPLFENAVKHGVQNSTEPVEIILELEKTPGEIKLKVSNTFDGQFARFRSEGVGLENIRNRLRLIYGNGNLLSVKADAGLFTASLSLPQREFHDDV